MGSEMTRQLERLLMLHVVDNLWVKHLTALDELREGIGLRAIGQRNPLIEYKREAFDMFDELKAAITHDTSRRIYFANLVREPARREARAFRPGSEPQRGGRAAPGAGGSPVRGNSASTVGRNDPCPCGSGRKYKNCCLRNEPAHATPGASGKPQADSAGAADAQENRNRQGRKKQRR